MPLEYFDDGEYYYSDEEEGEEEEYDEEDYGYDDEDYIPDTNPLFTTEEIKQSQWKCIKIGKTALSVSNEGKIIYHGTIPHYITKGDREIGSPYRYIQVCMENNECVNHYVHDIVWMTFNTEPILDGWEIRHLDYTEMDPYQCYINHIDNLQLCKKNISRTITLTPL